MIKMDIGDSAELFEDITPSKDGGVKKTIVKLGTGDEMPYSGSKVHVHYTGRLQDGTKFDSSRDRPGFFSFQLGKSEVIKGWDLTVPTMKINEVCEIVLSPEYGYGENGFPPSIPENATLIFEIELLGWEDEEITSDGGVKKRIVKTGDGVTRPNLDAEVKVHIRGTFEGTVFDERDVEFIIGNGYKNDIVDGIEKALLKMKKHERAKVYIKAQYGFQSKGHEEFGVPPNANIEYEIVLYSFERALEIYEMQYSEKLERSQVLKERALPLFKMGEYHKAMEFYERILKMVKVNKLDSDYPKGLPFKISALSNIALCYLKLKDFSNVITYCEKVLELEANNIKANFRIAEAHAGCYDYIKAIKYFDKVLELEPGNTSAKKQIAYAKTMQKKNIEKEKKLYSSIFSKMSSQ